MERWPRSVYRVGEEPDARFSFANERTFLAWIRTSLGLLAAAVALSAFDVPENAAVRFVLTWVLTGSAILLPLLALARWATAERALRQSKPLPGSWLSLGVTIVLLVFGVCVVIALAIPQS
jgi:putative membrane protein